MIGATRLAWLSPCISTRCVEAAATYPRNARFSNDVSRLRIGTDIVMHDSCTACRARIVECD
ncbi:unnamed protein product [Burkholderia pseudomallei]|nr:unnamed protein product [Burkholderia pseudomallei]